MRFNILVILIMVGGWGFGRLFKKIHVPAAIGMLFWGILLGILFRQPYFSQGVASATLDLLRQLEPFLKSLALVIILLRGGLGIQREALNRHGLTAFLMAWIPALCEMGGIALLLHYFFGWEWGVSFLASPILSAVSLAVVVPAMLQLKQSGVGKKNDVPTMVLVASSLDNVLAVTLFSILLSLINGKSGSIENIFWLLPWGIIGGVVVGIVAGLILSAFFEKRYTNIRATEKALIIFMMALMITQVGDIIHASSLVAIVMVGFVLVERAPRVAHEVARKMNVLWVPAEIVLFVLVGMDVDVRNLLSLGVGGVLVIFGGLVFRSLGVLLATSAAKISWKERLFCVFSYLPKATVQAVLGSVPLAYGVPHGEVILALSVAAIVITAPLGAWIIEQFSVPLLDIDLHER